MKSLCSVGHDKCKHEYTARTSTNRKKSLEQRPMYKISGE
uniref:Uncharacterized protein n=1 Tax=Arundo donax TaxID=35708 RepID=A0A0A9FF74_ARUDO